MHAPEFNSIKHVSGPVLVTGHTGFKGTWLSIILETLGIPACGYSLGATFRPTWMDVPPMIYSGNPLVMEPGMVFFVHIMIPDTRTGLAAGVGQTFIIGNDAAESLSQIPLELHCL